MTRVGIEEEFYRGRDLLSSTSQHVKGQQMASRAILRNSAKSTSIVQHESRRGSHRIGGFPSSMTGQGPVVRNQNLRVFEVMSDRSNMKHLRTEDYVCISPTKTFV
jgi:hypothetical protein